MLEPEEHPVQYFTGPTLRHTGCVVLVKPLSVCSGPWFSLTLVHQSPLRWGLFLGITRYLEARALG